MSFRALGTEIDGVPPVLVGSLPLSTSLVLAIGRSVVCVQSVLNC